MQGATVPHGSHHTALCIPWLVKHLRDWSPEPSFPGTPEATTRNPPGKSYRPGVLAAPPRIAAPRCGNALQGHEIAEAEEGIPILGEDKMRVGLLAGGRALGSHDALPATSVQLCEGVSREKMDDLVILAPGKTHCAHPVARGGCGGNACTSLRVPNRKRSMSVSSVKNTAATT